MAKEMLINVSEGEECRIALVEDGKLEELYMERTSSTSHVGNIYKGRVTNVEASIQAAFVDFGLGRNGFLHISDLMPTYFGRRGEEIQETVGRKMARRDRPPIQRCLRRGDEIVVQVIKEGIGTKGPTLSSYLSIPGRILVMMPGMAKLGVSKKIEDDEERRRLRQILDGLKPPKDVGFIIRTAGIGKSKAEIQRDFTYLSRLWSQIEKKRDSGPGPMELYTEGDLVSRTVRDVYSTDVDTVVVDNKDVAKQVRDVIKLANPRSKNKVEFYEDPIPLFHKYNIEKDIELMHSRHVPLPSGGSLVIDSTEAIVAIDVNSGKMREHADAETTAFKTDMEAAEEIPRQLRLRDLGGVIICDFIDLRYERHRRDLEQMLHDKFKNDRAKTKVLRMSQFGIIEMTRQRMRPSLKRSIYSDCPHCKGAGLVKTPESMTLDVMRRLAIALHDQRVARIEMAVHPEAALYLQNRKRRALADLESETNKRILIRTDVALALDEAKIDLFDARDSRVYLAELGMFPELPPLQGGGLRRPGGPPQYAGGGGGRRGEQRGGGDRHRRGGGGGGPQQGRRHEHDEEGAEERFDRSEEAVDEREETREEEEAVGLPELAPAPRPPRPPQAPAQRPPQRQESYSNYTDNDVDLGEDEEAEAAQPPQPQQRDRGDWNRGGRRDDRRDQGRGAPPQQPQRQESRQDQPPRRDQRPYPQGAPGQGPGPGQGQPAMAGENGEAGGRRRRRRRRGGRGRNRHRQDQMTGDQFHAGGPQAEFAPGQEEVGAPEEAPEETFAGEEAADHLPPAELHETRDEAEREQPMTEAPDESAESPAVEPPAGEAAPPEKKKSRRRSSRGASRSRKKKTAATVADATQPSGEPPAAEASAAAEPTEEPPIVAKTGSTDRHHLIVEEDEPEEPLSPLPPSRPRTYRDLDEIPDDLE